VKKVHTSFLGSRGHDLTHDREASESCNTHSSVHPATPSQLQVKEELNQPGEIIVETTENVIDMQLAPEEALELSGNQGTETTSDTSTSFLGQVPITRTTDETKWEKNPCSSKLSL
jgi:phage gp45-like